MPAQTPSLTVGVVPAAATLPPGGEAAVVVHVANASDRVEQYRVDVRGLPEGVGVATSPDVLRLKPAETSTVTLTLRTDAERPPLAGRTVVGVVVFSPVRPEEVRRVVEVVVTTEPQPDLALSAQPEVVTYRNPVLTLDVENTGNTMLDVELSGRDPEGAVTVWLDRPVLRLAAHDRVAVTVRLSARRPLSGQEVRRAVTLRARWGGQETEQRVELTQRPVVRGGATKLVGAAAAVAVMAGAVLGSSFLLVQALGNANAAEDGGSGDATDTPAEEETENPGAEETTGATETPEPTDTPTSTEGGGGGDGDGDGDGEEELEPVEVDLTTPPDNGIGEQNQVISPGAYPGLALSAVPDPDRDLCLAVTSVSWAIFVDDGGTAVVPGFLALTDVDGEEVPEARCSDLELRIELVEPAAEVSVTFVGTEEEASGDPLTYELREPGGDPESTTVDLGEEGSLTLATESDEGIREVVLTGAPSGTGVVPALTSLTATPLAP